MSQKIKDFQEKVLKILAGNMEEFYLGGGTALSLYYFHHRESLDLDFFTKKFNKISIGKLTDLLSANFKKKIELVAQQAHNDKAKIMVYSLSINKKESLKIDFIQDYLKLIKPHRIINNIRVLSLEDIYLRKIYAITGTLAAEDFTGRRVRRGGRQEAKDFYDLYCLSSIFLRLSDFAFRYTDTLIREGIIEWFRTYNRMDMKTGLLELRLKKGIDYKDMEQHFKKEIDAILKRDIGAI